MGKQVRLQKLLASRGIASRRKCETIIEEQRVTVNGVIAKLGASVDPSKDRVKLDGRTLPAPPPVAYYLLYKPRGRVTTRNDESGRKTIFDDLGRLEAGVQAVGRLDLNTEGALLLTNDGDVANELAHSKNLVPKKYLVKVYRQPSGNSLRLITEGRVYLDGVPTKPAKVRVVETTDTGNCWLELTVTEGRNHLIRKIFDQLGHPVSKLRRLTFATLSINNMERGEIRSLSADEVRRIKEIADGKSPGAAGHRKKGKGFAKAKPKLRGRQRKHKTP